MIIGVVSRIPSVFGIPISLARPLLVWVDIEGEHTSPTVQEVTTHAGCPEPRETDVLVIGGGTAGVGAAIAAARSGVRALLVERYGFLGGVANVGLCLHTFHSSYGKRIVAGLPWEMILRMKELGGSTGPVFIENAHMKTTTPVDPETMKYVLQEMLLESGGEILYHTTALEVIVEDGALKGVVVVNKGGRQEIRARVVIDGTGDGDIAYQAGAPWEKGREGDGKMQRMSLVFKLGGVDMPRAFEAIGKGGAWAPLPLTGDMYPVWWSATLEKYAKEAEAEGLFLGTDEFWGNTVRKNEANINASRIQGVDGTSGDDLTRAEIVGKQQVHQLTHFLRKYVPGFANAYLLATAPFMGVRETRRIMGGHVLTGEDCLSGRKFHDGICKVGYPVDIHDPTSGNTLFTPVQGVDGSYDIPYRCLVPQRVENLLVIGRCISATHEGMASSRTMITGMMTGQAAGTAAALCLSQGVSPRLLDTDLLRESLTRQGVHLSEGPVPGEE
ncbi:MAG: FAD-dependent oxidoreductase [Bacillota bacterium]